MAGEDPSARRSRQRKQGARPSRKLTWRSRVRTSFRNGLDRVLAADWFWSAAFVLVIALLLSYQDWGGSLRAVQRLQVGDIAAQDIKAPSSFYRVEEELSNQRRREARDAVAPVYIYDTERGVAVLRALGALFEQGREWVERAGNDAQTTLEGRVPDADARKALTEARFSVELENQLKAVLTRVMGRRVVANKTLIEGQPAITLIRLPDRVEERLDSYDSLIALEVARAEAREAVADRLMLPARQERAVGELMASLVDANVHPDPALTQARRTAAAERVPLVQVKVREGDVLVRKGEPIDADTLRSLQEFSAERTFRLGRLLAVLLVAGTMAFFLFRYSSYHQRRFRKIKHLHALMVLLTLSMLLLGKAILWLTQAVANSQSLRFPFDQQSLYVYLIPLGAGSILVALLANGRIAIVYSSFLSLLFGAVNGWNAYLAIWAMLVQCGGVYAISTYRERAALLRAGLVVGGVGAAATLALETLQGNVEPLSRMLYGAGLAFVGGAVGVGLLISFSLPLLEHLFNVLTDIRLLELSNVNHPLLSQLAVKAPGSYSHSQVVGSLAEEAAKAIGAGSLFCRVAAFYHDVGKMGKPEYFVENQRGSNPHDRLAPSMSALIIASHVKDGIRVAREAGLPEQIVDIIPQHHGTRLMTYFYEKAKSAADPTLGPVKEDDFRYPGPRPQTREAAIFMLADAVEAAARTVDDPTPNRLRDVIRKVSNVVVLDGQLDECDLTFVDLKKIQDAFLRLLVSMYHHRVEYPGFDFNRPRGESRPAAEPAERKLARGGS